MSEENIEVVRSAFAAFQAGDMSGVTELMADDLVTHRVDPDNAQFRGKEGFFQALADWTEDFEDWTATPEDFIDTGEAVLVQVHQTARGAFSGVSVDSHFWFVFTVCDGSISRLAFHTRKATALEAAGVSE